MLQREDHMDSMKKSHDAEALILLKMSVTIATACTITVSVTLATACTITVSVLANLKLHLCNACPLSGHGYHYVLN